MSVNKYLYDTYFYPSIPPLFLAHVLLLLTELKFGIPAARGVIGK